MQTGLSLSLFRPVHLIIRALNLNESQSIAAPRFLPHVVRKKAHKASVRGRYVTEVAAVPIGSNK
jgi:hypothetical protein